MVKVASVQINGVGDPGEAGLRGFPIRLVSFSWPRYLVEIEACSAHHWARELSGSAISCDWRLQDRSPSQRDCSCKSVVVIHFVLLEQHGTDQPDDAASLVARSRASTGVSAAGTKWIDEVRKILFDNDDGHSV